jgi:hypothetical protein
MNHLNDSRNGDSNMNVNDITFGVEIETTLPAAAQTRVGGHGCGVQVPWLPAGWLADRDPSIQADAGRVACEFVSPVLKGSEGVQQLINAIRLIKEKGGQVNASCGLHIHVGFDRSDRKSLKRLTTLVANFEKAIFASTGTKSRENGRWCHGVQRYGQFDVAAQRSTCDRYHVLNLGSGKPTVEFRPFAATLNTIKILGYVRMCVGLVEKAITTKRVTKWTAKVPVTTSPIHRSGEGQTALTRLFYALGWTKGREAHVYGNVVADNCPDMIANKKELMRLARKYDHGIAVVE